MIDYSATKGAITSFTRSLATNLATKKIRVNAVAPGSVWTPLIVSTFAEGYQWSLLSALGLASVLIGNVLVLRGPGK